MFHQAFVEHLPALFGGDTETEIFALRIDIGDQVGQQQAQRIQLAPLFGDRQVLGMHAAAEVEDQCGCDQLSISARFMQHDLLREPALQQLKLIQPVRRCYAMPLQNLGQQRMESIELGPALDLHAGLARLGNGTPPLGAECRPLA